MIGQVFCEKHGERKPGLVVCHHIIDDGESISHYSKPTAVLMAMALCGSCNSNIQGRLLTPQELAEFYIYCAQCGEEALRGIARPS